MQINRVVAHEGFIRIEWQSTGDPYDVGGWGQVDIIVTNSKVVIDSETLGREFVMKLLKQIVDNAKMDYE
jgi:hypothetical protein